MILGQPHQCTDYILPWKSNVQKISLEKTFGNEKSKLQIQPIGILAIEFLVKHFESMFSYDYTKQMEEDLDSIANTQTKIWNELCQECLDEITSLSKKISKVEKEKYFLDEQHELIFTQYGPSIRKIKDDGSTEYFKVQENLDMEKLRNNEYNLETILMKKPESLGIYENYPLNVKKGRFGYYLEWNDQTYSLKAWTSTIDNFSYEDALEVIKTSKKDPNIIRILNTEISIRKGKFGPYVFYKTSTMKKPKFFPLKKCPLKYDECDEKEIKEWIQTTYLEGK